MHSDEFASTKESPESFILTKTDLLATRSPPGPTNHSPPIGLSGSLDWVPSYASGSDPFSHHKHTRDSGFRWSISVFCPGPLEKFSCPILLFLFLGSNDSHDRATARITLIPKSEKSVIVKRNRSIQPTSPKQYLPNGPRGGNVTGPSSE